MLFLPPTVRLSYALVHLHLFTEAKTIRHLFLDHEFVKLLEKNCLGAILKLFYQILEGIKTISVSLDRLARNTSNGL